jgi:hypothetical protein
LEFFLSGVWLTTSGEDFVAFCGELLDELEEWKQTSEG